MNAKQFAVFFLALAIALGLWFFRTSAPVAQAARAIGLSTPGSTPSAATLQAAGVHKCVGSGGTTYIDGACPQGSHEVAANGGTMTVTAFPKPVPSPSSIASSVFGEPIVKPMSPEERDRLRDKAIDDTANRR